MTATIPASSAAGPWTPRVTLGLAVLAAAGFIYVTAEIMPVGALPAIAGDLGVSEAMVATLLASYALVAALSTVPLVRWTAHWPRRRTLLLTLISLTASQLISALAPTFAVLAAGRVLCALTHGLMWSVVAPIGARLVPATHAARATTAVYVGTGFALVVGSPLTAALSQMWGWRLAVVAITVAAAVVLVAARFTLPPMATTAVAPTGGARRPWHHQNRRLVIMCALTLVGVTGHFISYAFIVVIISDIVGISGPNLAWLLAGYGVCGLLAMGLLARPGDRRPKATIVACMAGLTAVFAVLAGLGFGHGSGVGTVIVGVVAILGWGATATAVPPLLQTAAMRHSPEDPDGASGLYVTAFQIGIMAGSLIGGLLFEHAGEPIMLTVSAVLIASALVCVAAGRDLFGAPPTPVAPAGDK
ncbi:MAG TPA: MFS transporter [Mycobacterium sp.]|nr:MFS transporter [Mycobacterium sp.]HQC76385.1 MFS transporter [Mycobacterium sp.]